MSIYHRYTIFYRIQRYQSDIDKLGGLVSKCEIVDDIAEDSASINPDLSATETTCEGPSGDSGITPSGNAGNEETAEKQNTPEIQNDQRPDIDKENCNPHDDDDDGGRDESLTDGEGSETPDAQLDGQAKAVSVTEGEVDEVSTQSTSISSATSTGSATEDGPQFKITRRQLNRVRTCDRILKRLSEGLVKNISRIEKEKKELSSQTISHFWCEAARLNGTGKIKSPKAIEREMATSGWWEDEPSKENTEDSVQVLGNVQNAPGPIAKHVIRKPSSPLHRLLQPDDMVWEDEKSKWQLGLGRLMDDQGRRYVKI
ncbi:hypothetical protein Sste5346_003674 [Sporothrix stenoceras]|uniref:DUF4050 domain-containing protein n=1 Tax=Sporothrix stenoceras TaxID=5173 RepID=A0ABR3ZC59_9PEZI